MMYYLDSPMRIRLPDGSVKVVTEAGKVNVMPGIMLDEVLLVPEFKHNLLSVSRLLMKSGMRSCFDRQSYLLQDPITEQVIAKGIIEDGLYKLKKGEEINNVAYSLRTSGIVSNVKDDLGSLHVR